MGGSRTLDKITSVFKKPSGQAGEQAAKNDAVFNEIDEELDENLDKATGASDPLTTKRKKLFDRFTTNTRKGLLG